MPVNTDISSIWDTFPHIVSRTQFCQYSYLFSKHRGFCISFLNLLSSLFSARLPLLDDLGEWHWNMYNIIYETNRQSRFDAWYRMLGAGALGWPRGMGREVRGGFRMGNMCTPVVDSCWCMAKPIQYCKVISLQLK